MQRLGAGALTQRELLAVVLRCGTRGVDALALADTLLTRFGGLNALARADSRELQSVLGIGRVRAVEIKAALEIGRRALLEQAAHRVQIKTPADVASLLMPDMCGLEQEEVRTVLLDTRNRVLGAPLIYRGGLNAVGMRVGELFKHAIRANAAGVIVAHNHPSTDASPSNDDVLVTRELVKAGKLLEIDVVDHLVIGHNTFVSLKERRLGFEA
jgi:DNA repair protein RadC